MKLSKKHKKLFYKTIKKYNTKLRTNGKTSRTPNENSNGISLNCSQNLIEDSHMYNSRYKLPVLTVIEASQEKSDTACDSSACISDSSQVLFNDYLLISSRVKFQYLIHSLFDKAQFQTKENYKILNGALFVLFKIFFNFAMSML
jgi:hypothetical protein